MSIEKDASGVAAAGSTASHGESIGGLGNFLTGSNRPKQKGTPYSSAGGGEAYFNPSPTDFFSYFRNFIFDEGGRQSISGTMIRGPDLHTRPPQWMEDKEVSIDGTPLTEEQRTSTHFWQAKYRKELDVGEAIQEVKKQKRMEATHDVIGSFAWIRRRLGLAEPLDEHYAQQKAEKYHKHLEVLRDGENADNVESDPRRRQGLDLGTPWRIIMESLETGQPLAKVANEYRPRLDFYGLDPFLDSSLSLMWFSTKCGIAIGIAQGTTRAIQTLNVDVQFLKASGVGILSILNMSIFASVVKWGGNCALFAGAFCVGDRMARIIKFKLLPPHDARHRSTTNYVLGLAMSGGTVGILPWWILSDTHLAIRLSASGVFVGGMLGFVVGTVLSRLVALNLARLDVSNRDLRRYEALMQRQRNWAEKKLAKHHAQSYVWW